MVTEAIRKDRHLQIKRFIYFNDNSKIDISNKLYKLQPLINTLKERFLKFLVPSKNLLYDECMVQYFGHHSNKQCIRNKPIRFRYKVWCVNAENWLPGQFIVGRISQSVRLKKKLLERRLPHSSICWMNFHKIFRIYLIIY